MTKPKLVQYDRRLPALAKPHTLGHAPWRQGDEKVPLKEALNGQAEVRSQYRDQYYGDMKLTFT